MSEYTIPFTITFRLEESYFCLCIHMIKKENQPYVLIQLEPLFH